MAGLGDRRLETNDLISSVIQTYIINTPTELYSFHIENYQL
jgi:hypothetical protein